MLDVGQQVKIPGQAPAQYGGYASYTIQAGDTLSAIAQRFNVCAQTLLSINDLTDPDHLSAGQVIKVPGNAALPRRPTPRRPCRRHPIRFNQETR